MKTSEIKDLIFADTLSKKGDVYTARRGYFFSGGNNSVGFAERIKRVFPNAVIIDHGDHWAAFRGGASTAQSSHWWVKFKLVDSQSGLPAHLRL
jgi:hypothetical protein